MSKLTDNERAVCLKLLELFEIEGKKASEIATEGQIEIFAEIIFRKHKRLEILCATQYGKSLFVALACLVVTCIQGEMIAVVAPKDEKAKIIMRYFIAHLSDHQLFYSQLEKNTKLERLQMEESKERIIMRGGGGIYVISAQAGNARKGIEAAMGEGAKNVILDEAGLVPDEIEATIFRMIAGKGPEAFYCKIGNPFYLNHFHDSWLDERYHKIFIDFNQGILEGRYSSDFIAEAKRKPHFGILYGCEFPPEDIMDDKGYIKLFTKEDIEKAKKVVEPFGEKRLGVDIAEGGGDSNVIVLKTANYAGLLMKFQNEDTMAITGHTISTAKELEVDDRNIFMDTIGVGKGPYDRMHEQLHHPTSVKFSEKADDDVQFANLRAECYWRMRDWIIGGGALDPEDDWSQLLHIKYKVDSSGRMLMMPKEELRKVIHGSPDLPDALAMTFARRSVMPTKEDRVNRDLLKQFDAHRMKRNVSGRRY